MSDGKVSITVKGLTKRVYPPMDPRAPEHAKILAQAQAYRESTQITIQTFCPGCGKPNSPVTTSLEQFELYQKGEISSRMIWGSEKARSAGPTIPQCSKCIKEI